MKSPHHEGDAHSQPAPFTLDRDRITKISYNIRHTQNLLIFVWKSSPEPWISEWNTTPSLPLQCLYRKTWSRFKERYV